MKGTRDSYDGDCDDILHSHDGDYGYLEDLVAVIKNIFLLEYDVLLLASSIPMFRSDLLCPYSVYNKPSEEGRNG
jgi:hypothetical protein